MSFSDLEHGWTQLLLTLANVKILRGVQLQHRDRGGEWNERNPPILLSSDRADADKRTAAYEMAQHVRYADVTRRLTAEARTIAGLDAELRLGVPENRQADHVPKVSCLEALQIEMFDVGSENVRDCLERSHIQYLKPDTEHDFPGGIYAYLFVPSTVFDKLEALCKVSGDGFQITLNAKIWHWYGPIGDCHYYFDVAEWQKAEFVGMATQEIVKSAPPFNMSASSSAAVQARAHAELVGQLTLLRKGIASTRTAVWFVALGILGLVVVYLTR